MPSPLYRCPEGDDTSLEEVPTEKFNSPKTLQERAAQAWAVRREKNAALLAKKAKEHQISNQQVKRDNTITENSKSAKVGVSFGKEDTVHHYLLEEEEDTTYFSDGDRSLNSEYTKTLESEVEDVIKDILMIGDGSASKPGRRKFKHKHSVKRRLRKQSFSERDDSDRPREEAGDAVNVGDDIAALSRYRVNTKSHDHEQSAAGDSSTTLGTGDSESIGAKNTDSNQSGCDKPEEAQDGPIQLVLGFVEGGVNAVTSALGLFPREPDSVDHPSTSLEENAKTKCNDTLASDALSRYAQSAKSPLSNSCTEDIVPFLNSEGKGAGNSTDAGRMPTEPVKKFVDYAQDFLYGQQGNSGESEVSTLHDPLFVAIVADSNSS